MDNLTEMRGGVCVLREGVDTDAALRRLGSFEALRAAVDGEYADTCAKLEELRAAGKTKSATFRQLLAQKLTLSGIIARFDAYGV